MRICFFHLKFVTLIIFKKKKKIDFVSGEYFKNHPNICFIVNWNWFDWMGNEIKKEMKSIKSEKTENLEKIENQLKKLNEIDVKKEKWMVKC